MVESDTDDTETWRSVAPVVALNMVRGSILNPIYILMVELQQTLRRPCKQKSKHMENGPLCQFQ